MTEQAMWAAWVQEPECVLIVAPGAGAWRLSPAAFKASMGDRKRIIRARAEGHLHDFHHLEYDPAAATAKAGIDCIGRRYLTIGPMIATACLASEGGSNDMFRDLDRLFTYRGDADSAAQDVARLATQWGGTVARR